MRLRLPTLRHVHLLFPLWFELSYHRMCMTYPCLHQNIDGSVVTVPGNQRLQGNGLLNYFLELEGGGGD